MPRLRVAFVSAHGCPIAPLGSRSAGGMSIVLQDLSIALSELGVEVDIYAPEHGPCDPEFFLDDPRFYDEAGILWRSVYLKPPRLIHLDAEDFSRSLLRHRLSDDDSGGASYDLVHSHYWRSAEAGLRLARQLGAPHVFTYHTIAEVKERAGGAPETPERKQAELLAVRESDAVVTFTREEAQSLVELLGLDPRRARTVRMGVDLGIFTPQSVRWRRSNRARMDIGLDERVMLFVGRVEPFKGPDMLVRALAHMRTPDPLRLVVVGGEESSFEWLADIARAHGVARRLDWRGPVPHEALSVCYGAADICVVPSRHETFGLVALEAMASCTPVAASNVGGLRTIVQDGKTGVLFEPGDPRVIAQTLDGLFADPARLRRMGSAARRRARAFSWEESADRVLSVYESLA